MTPTYFVFICGKRREREREREAENCIRTFIIDFCLFGGVVVVVVLLLLLLLLMVMSTHRQDNGVFFPSFFFFHNNYCSPIYIYIRKRDRMKKKRQE